MVPQGRYAPSMSENESNEAGATPEGPPEIPTISIDAFAAVELRTGCVVSAAPHPDADRLLVMQVDVGEESPRQIIAGIRAHWEPEDLVGRTLIICCNLKPARLRGLESQGMMLAVTGDDRVWPLGIEGDVNPGVRVS